jgi:hypothetical protein
MNESAFYVDIINIKGYYKQKIYIEKYFDIDNDYNNLIKHVEKKNSTEIYFRDGYSNILILLDKLSIYIDISSFDMVYINNFNNNEIKNITTIYNICDYIYIKDKCIHILPSKHILLLKFDLQYDGDDEYYKSIIGSYNNLNITLKNNFNFGKLKFNFVTTLKLHFYIQDNEYSILQNFINVKNLEIYFKYKIINSDILYKYSNMLSEIYTIKVYIRHKETREVISLLEKICDNVTIIEKY